MDIFFAARMGGPEVGNDIHNFIIQTRMKIKGQFEGVEMVGISAIDIQVFLNGSVTEYFKSGGVKSVKFNKKKKEVVVDICFTQGELGDLGALVQLLRERMAEAAIDMRSVSLKNGAEFDLDTFNQRLKIPD
ncbi:Imm12 family immunity protein [Xanthomonas oryzae]|uniref:Imm12 family immunity protein n=1 Tax=Xanthomonas oryzae TaxID=347 RepID=UPI0011F1B7D1|nr:Imm12 family immunity protein [Xanthomonas oryzae]QEO96315.1 hypothetical protein XOCgx_1322 [Xanthomonas oryzae pv. oryzicola]QGH65319.1 hypothetical protein GHV42_05895 [Xanthomonas oryzae pv. oryzicola]UBB94014.1 immunity protein 12 [Xanthomonas oryzae pv. oryzicola]WGY41979.1 immunity protein 12 [Xanthomonas oryzae pv. oryzicola]